ncbi:wax ester/triacylglycerol synthase family O-acyltransferase [Saccharopolyspora shandongensis]|uniref:wax ester/triacylglycerol synthase family O-acyltransferase n=1 Tax=Saccharopolyspora shandongensis TaxID=418495 RepID=UPI003404BD97
MAAGEVSALDWAFLCLEQDAAPMHIGAVAVFAPHRQVDPVRIAELLAERAQRLARLRLRVHPSWFPPGHAYWEEHHEFRAQDHVHTHQLPSPGGREELAALVAELNAVPLDLSKPLWELHVINGLDGDRFAVLAKLHHALVDGCGAINVGLGLLDGFTPEPPPQRAASPREPGSVLGDAWRAVGTLRRPDRLLGNVLSAASDLPRTIRQTSETLGIAATVLGHLRLPAADSPLHAPASGQRRVALVPLDLQSLRRIRTRHGGTTNDVALAVVTGALRRWLGTRGHLVDGLTVRALIPVSQRPHGKPGDDNNQLSGYLCDLPVGEPDPVTRLQKVRAAMHRNKSAGPLRGPGALAVLAGRVPPIAHLLAAPLAGHGAGLLFDTVITNVPLPDIPVSLDGSTLREFYPLAPLAAGHALSVAVTQYRDTVHIGVQAHRFAVSDLEKLSEALPHAVAELDDLSL